MIIAVMTRGDEAVWGSFLNSDTIDLLDGVAVVLDTTATGNDLGRKVKRSIAAGENTVVGLVQGKTIPIGSFGLVQTYGVHRNASVADAVNAANLPLHTIVTVRGQLTTTATPVASASVGTSLTAGAGDSGAQRATVFLKCM